MGLAGVKVKQRIGNDPRNLNWSENAARFGHAYLSKFGWTSEDGLGSNKDGRRSHITVAQKLNMLGIGGDRPDGPDAIAWKQNKDFEGVLERLNRVRQDESSATPSDADGESKDNADQVETGKAEPSSSDDRKGRKLEKKQRKAEKALRKARKQKGKERADGENDEQEVSRTTDSVRAKPPIRMAHRARHRAAKGMVGLSAAALAEVLGESSSASPAVTPGTSTPLPEPPVIPDPQFTTSTKSISDYFKQKLQTKGQTAMPSSRTAEPDYEDYERPRFGLGSSRRVDSFTAGDDPPPLREQDDNGRDDAPIEELPETNERSTQPLEEDLLPEPKPKHRKKKKRENDGDEEPEVRESKKKRKE